MNDNEMVPEETTTPEAPAAAADAAPAEGLDTAAAGSTEDLEPATPEDVAAAAQEFVTGLLQSIGLEAEVTTSVEGSSAFIDVAGESLGSLIGRRGQTLDALQELTRTAVQRRLRARVRLLVDVEGYRARRRASLIDYARAIAERAKERGTEIELEPMTAYERKIVHDAVAEVDGASSFSEGEEPNRKVVVRGE
ncbi:MAG TPA: RNA-binding cell elongation regulator Jag/EloR [Actinomycetota bacterium]|nr:RNA-binding cell elongation regulator Jag/EloR [Actinomycetota bacterium]